MTYYAGLDVSLKEISICIVDMDGEIVAQGTAPADPTGVAGWLKNRSRHPRGLCMKVDNFRSGSNVE